MKTRHKFEVEGYIVCGDQTRELHFKVQSDTKINRLINILCEIMDKNAEDVKNVTILSQTLRCMRYNPDCRLTFRDIAVVGKRNLKVVVEV